MKPAASARLDICVRPGLISACGRVNTRSSVRSAPDGARPSGPDRGSKRQRARLDPKADAASRGDSDAASGCSKCRAAPSNPRRVRPKPPPRHTRIRSIQDEPTPAAARSARPHTHACHAYGTSAQSQQLRLHLMGAGLASAPDRLGRLLRRPAPRMTHPRGGAAARPAPSLGTPLRPAHH